MTQDSAGHLTRHRSGSSPRQTAARKRKFIKLLAEHGNVSEACRIIRVHRSLPSHWAEADPEFKAAMEQAQEASVDRLELEARRRAEEGVEEPVYQSGRLVGTKRVYSDSLMALLLRANRPEKYGGGGMLMGRDIGQVTFTLDFGFAKQPALTESPPALEGVATATYRSDPSDDHEAGDASQS